MDFSKAGEMMKLQQEAMKIKKELENTIIEAEHKGLVVSINGEMKVEKVDFETTELIGDKAGLEEAIMIAVNKGVKKSQEVAAEKMQGVMGAMGINLPQWGMPWM